MRFAVLPVLLLAATSLADDWSQTFRDVWVDGELDRAARVYVADEPRRFAVQLPGERYAIVVATEGGTLSRLELDAPTLGETSWKVRSSKAPKRQRGRASRPDSRRWLIQAGKRTLLIGPHVGPVGAITPAEIAETVPAWGDLQSAHEPDAELVEALAAIDRPLTLDLSMGTWCGDSRREVPRLLKAIELADNDRLSLQITALSNEFDAPLDQISGSQLTNVPTLRILEEESELGRIVETPAGDSFLADLLQIVDATAPDHIGRWDRGEEIASGTLVTSQAGDEIVERWQLWKRDDEEEAGTLLRSVLTSAAGRVVVYHRRDAEGKSELVEVTRSIGEHHTRTRASSRESGVTVVSRGDATGILRQRLPAGELITPSAVDAAGLWRALGQPNEWSGQAWLVEGRPAARATDVTLKAGAVGDTLLLEQDAETACRLSLDPELGLVLSSEGCRRSSMEQIDRR